MIQYHPNPLYNVTVHYIAIRCKIMLPRASANRSLSARGMGFPTIARPGFPDKSSYDYDHVREGYPEAI
jgi:hypothetical protein